MTAKTYVNLTKLSDSINMELSGLLSIVKNHGYDYGLTEISMDTIKSSCPGLYSWVSDIAKQEPWLCYIVCTQIGSNYTNAHVDSWHSEALDGTVSTSAVIGVNVPLLNCVKTFTSFYKYISGPIDKKYFDRDGITYIYYGQAHLTEIDRYKLTDPVAINTSVIHSVINMTSDTRWALSFRFKNDPWHLFES